ncbi:conserved exported hypothetical protein [Candidatus Sulfopaludibacter sp. SbA3]|nr:conserved exported hypothetical protein [Candidatus Sulfopaludibacter sp. SbA3]
MLVPSKRLLQIAVALFLPLIAAAGFSPRLAAPCGGLFALCLLVVAVDAWAGWRRAEQIAPRVPESLRLTKDVAGALPVTLQNSSGGELKVRVGLGMPEGMESETKVLDPILPSGPARFDWRCTGRARGDHRLRQVHIEALSPLGLWEARAAKAVDCTFRVYPNMRDRATAGLFLKTASLGVRTYRQVGKGREFEQLRQYLSGDSFEDIHWKATAKRGYPTVKLYRVENAQEVYAVIDSSRLSAREGILENYVNAALHLALVSERQGDRFGLVTFSNRTHKFLRARNGLDHFRLCRETIYNLRAERVSPDFRDVMTSLQLNLRRRALLVFFTSLDDALLAETFEHDIGLLARRHVVLVNVTQTTGMTPLFTQPTENLESLYQGLAGQLLWNRMRTLKIALQNRGVKLSIVDPERIKAQVTAQYLDVKRRQVL